MKISPKAVAALAVPIIAAIALFLITGEERWLIGVLAGLASGGGAVAAPPARRVKQRDVDVLAQGRKPLRR